MKTGKPRQVGTKTIVVDQLPPNGSPNGDPQARDVDDVGHLAELRWAAAIGSWFEGDPAALAVAIRDPSLPINDNVREFLADLASGRINKGTGGRPTERHGWQERAIAARVFAEWERLKFVPRHERQNPPKEAACAQIATEFGTTEDAVRGLIDKFKKLNITLENWVRWGRPAWKNK